MHTHARLYTIEARIAFTAAGALFLLIFTLPASVTTGRPLFRWMVRLLVAAAVICGLALVVAKIWLNG